MKKLITLYILFEIYIICQAQDPQFSQFYAVPLYLGPSYAGTTKGSRVNLNYRNQWPALGKSFTTIAFSYDHYFYKFQSGLGVLFLRDRAGEGKLGITNAGFQYSFNIIVNKYWRIRPGVHFVYTQKSIDFSALTLPSGDFQGTSTQHTPLEKVLAFDFGTSILAYTNVHWFGFSVDHLTQPNLSLYETEEYKLPIKYQVFGGTRLTKRGRLIRSMSESLNGSFLFKTQGGKHQLDFGGYWYKEPLMIGVWLRALPFYKIGDKRYIFSRDALILMAGYKVENMSFAYSFDATISNLLITKTAGSHEISMMYLFNQEWERMKRPKKRPVPCPTF